MQLDNNAITTIDVSINNFNLYISSLGELEIACKHSPCWLVMLLQFLVLTNFHSCFYNCMETWKCFLFLKWITLENSTYNNIYLNLIQALKGAVSQEKDKWQKECVSTIFRFLNCLYSIFIFYTILKRFQFVTNTYTCTVEMLRLIDL